MKRIAIFAIAALVGCTSMPTVEQIGTHKNRKYAIGSDVGTTIATQIFTNRLELNPFVNGCYKTLGLAPHAGIILCSIAAGIIAYQIITRIDNPKVTAAAVVIESGMAARNVYVFGH